jgi:hypothetical protein
MDEIVLVVVGDGYGGDGYGGDVMSVDEKSVVTESTERRNKKVEARNNHHTKADIFGALSSNILLVKGFCLLFLFLLFTIESVLETRGFGKHPYCSSRRKTTLCEHVTFQGVEFFFNPIFQMLDKASHTLFPPQLIQANMSIDIKKKNNVSP